MSELEGDLWKEATSPIPGPNEPGFSRHQSCEANIDDMLATRMFLSFLSSSDKLVSLIVWIDHPSALPIDCLRPSRLLHVQGIATELWGVPPLLQMHALQSPSKRILCCRSWSTLPRIIFLFSWLFGLLLTHPLFSCTSRAKRLLSVKMWTPHRLGKQKRWRTRCCTLMICVQKMSIRTTAFTMLAWRFGRPTYLVSAI